MWVCLKNGLLNQAQWRPHWDMIWNINNLTLKLGVFETAIFTINAWRLNLKKCWYTHTYVYIYIQTTHLTDKHGDAPESWFPTWAWVWIFDIPHTNQLCPTMSFGLRQVLKHFQSTCSLAQLHCCWILRWKKPANIGWIMANSHPFSGTKVGALQSFHPIPSRPGRWFPGMRFPGLTRWSKSVQIHTPLLEK